MTNLLIEWFPDTNERYLLCAHYTPAVSRSRSGAACGTLVGANDGGSGNGLLMELGRKMQTLQGRRGIDFVLFDGGNSSTPRRIRIFSARRISLRRIRPRLPRIAIGPACASTWWATPTLRFAKEPIGVRYARFVVDDVWGAAARPVFANLTIA